MTKKEQAAIDRCTVRIYGRAMAAMATRNDTLISKRDIKEILEQEFAGVIEQQEDDVK